MKPPRTGYRKIPSWLFSCPDILPEDKLVLSVILAFQKAIEGVCTYKQADIGTICGLSRKAVNLAIARLACRDKGRNNTKTTCYRFPVINILPHENPKTGRLITVYLAPTHRDSPCWWMQEAEAGRSTIPLKNRRPERNTAIPKNALAITTPKSRSQATHS